MYAFRIVNTTAISPRPSPTVATIVKATRGVRRNDRSVNRTSRTTLSSSTVMLFWSLTFLL